LTGQRTHAAGVGESLKGNFETALAAIESLDAVAVQPARHGVTATDLRNIIKERRNRDKFFRQGLFADPAWDMLLELHLFEALSQIRIARSRLCLGAAVPATTALRWISALEAEGLIERRSDPLDGRRVFIALSPRGLDQMKAYFRSSGQKRCSADA
jgi:DNA-binding MarR family transcriptional regulator